MANATQAAIGICWCDLSCNESREPAGKHLPEPGRSGVVPSHPDRGVRQDPMAGACVLPDAEPFSSGAGDAAAQPGGRHEMVAGRLHQAI